MTNKTIIRMHLEYHLTETKQKGNLSVWGLLHYCLGYYGEIDEDMIGAVRDLHRDGWVIV